MSQRIPPALIRVMPAIFVVLWSTGFIGARYAMPYAPPFLFLSLRFVSCIVLIGLFAHWRGADWPRGRVLVSALATGALIHATYLGAVFWAVKHGFPAGFAGLIVGLQPVLTALLAGPITGERVSLRQWLGFAIGLLGVVLVLGPKLMSPLGANALINALVCFGGVAAFALGTVLQKRFGSAGDLVAGTAVQYAGALIIALPLALLFEPLDIAWTGELIFALLWLVLVLSIGAIGLLLVMIRAGEVARVSSLFYLVPAVTAVFAYFLFGEELTPIQLFGIAVVTIGVALATMRGSRRIAVRI